jgi:pyridoxine/pyridoxamine 5'-phosphate oxidase
MSEQCQAIFKAHLFEDQKINNDRNYEKNSVAIRKFWSLFKIMSHDSEKFVENLYDQ